MEPTQAPITRYVVHSTVLKVEERKAKLYVSGVGGDAIFNEVSRGWFVWLDGSFEAIHLGLEKPEFEKGDKVKVTFERIAP